ncbi:MAG: hypothetical protein RMZ43_000125 [Nostoc sp. CmiVER01]|uniref:hypothetical protein n=1 Tax=Nostoc sp. CmiVER01 TaxID=3075384 RepID=UPI002AD4A036|nr:hypothetical protein [Nostoc sp. CmiVER01]MDZ8121878.1 hypothetical protein [Nostoc sp. CmiVER01]
MANSVLLTTMTDFNNITAQNQTIPTPTVPVSPAPTYTNSNFIVSFTTSTETKKP